MVGWVKMPRGTEVGLGPGHIVLDQDPAPPHRKGHSSPSCTCAVYSCIRINNGPCILWPNGWMDQNATWYGGKPQPGDIVLDGDPAPPPPQKGAHHPHTHFLAHVYCGQTVAHLSNCWALVMATLYSRCGHYIFAVWFLLSFFLSFFSSPSLSSHRVDVYHTSTHGVALLRN